VDWPQKLAASAAAAATPKELFALALDHIKFVFGASVAGVLPLDAGLDEDAAVAAGLRSVHIREYLTAWRSRDPVLSTALAARVPIRETDVPPPRNTWNTTPFCVDFARRVGISCYMVAPLYGADGEISGTMHIARQKGSEPFRAEHVRCAMAFAAFLSAMLARQPLRAPFANEATLAPREHQVALLAVRGKSNPLIARELGLTTETVKRTLRRVYRKTNVNTRIELTRRCAQLGWT
jgi:DNA-binding CsgD family transcriptional regulator